MDTFEEQYNALSTTGNSGTGQRTCCILRYMANEHGTQAWIARLRSYGILQNKHGVDTNMFGVNLYLQQCRNTGLGGNKSDACDVQAIFAVWLKQAQSCLDDVVQLRKLALKHGRSVYLELRVMGGDACAAACGQEALGVLACLCEDVGATWQDLVRQH